MISTRRILKVAAIFVALMVLASFVLTGSARAAEFRGGDTIVIPAGEVIDDDLLISGNRVEVNGTIRGDLMASGVEVTVNGTVEGSLFIAGQTLVANGPVGGSLYGAGYALTIAEEAEITRNVFFGGFSIQTERDSTIGRSIYIGGYQALLNGEVANDVEIGGGALELNGVVGGDVTGEVTADTGDAPPSIFFPSFPGAVPIERPGLRVGSEAEIGGVLDVKETQPPVPDEPRVGDRPNILLRLGTALGRRAGEFVALLIVGGLLIRFWPDSMQRPVEEAQERPLPSAGWGCLISLIFFAAVPIVGLAILLLAALGGLVTFGQLFNHILSLGAASLGLIVTIVLFVISVVTKAVVAFLGGRLILRALASQEAPGGWYDFASLALGALIYEILRAIPFLGWLIGVIVTLIGLGAIAFALQKWLRPGPAVEALPPETPPAEAAA